VTSWIDMSLVQELDDVASTIVGMERAALDQKSCG
jgi:hypothetical protein